MSERYISIGARAVSHSILQQEPRASHFVKKISDSVLSLFICLHKFYLIYSTRRKMLKGDMYSKEIDDAEMKKLTDHSKLKVKIFVFIVQKRW